MPLFQNTYRKLDRDTAVNKYDASSYYDSRNMRMTGIGELQSGAITNIKGNSLVVSIMPSGYTTDVIIGSKKIRDKIIIFSTNNDDAVPSGAPGRIWSVPANKSPLISTDFTLLYDGLLNFSRKHPITDIVTFYESDLIQKVYWTDFNNELRFCNIADTNLSTYDPDYFNIVNEISFSIPTLTKIVSGSIPNGMVQYAYRLYKLNGPSSNFSPAGQMIPVTDSSESQGTSRFYKGGEKLDASGNPLSSGKGMYLTISGMDTNYDRIEVVAIHYDAINATPTINIVEVSPVASTVRITDEGDWTNGQYSLDEFVLVSNPFKAKTIATKNNILFAGNITQSEYDLTFDARAYRWANNAVIVDCRIYEQDGGYWYNDDISPTQWTYYPSGGGGYSVTGMANIPTDIDAICRNNIQYDKTQASSASYLYHQDGTTIGGEGPNVSYTFSVNGVTSVMMDDSLDNKTFHQSSYLSPSYYIGTDGPNFNQSRKGWERDEIYRFGLVFFDIKGRPSPVKWIGDIRIPNNYHQISFYAENIRGAWYYDSGDSTTKSVPIEINLQVDNIPSTAEFVQVVYAPRTSADRTVVAQGQLSWLFDSAVTGKKQFRIPHFSTVSAYQSAPTKYLYMFSPEFSFLRDFTQGNNDYVEIIGQTVGVYTMNHSDPRHYVQKITALAAITPDDTKWSTVTESRLEEATTTRNAEHQIKSFGTVQYKPGMMYLDVAPRHFGDIGTCLMVETDAVLNTSGMSSSYQMLANYRRNLYGSQYGGNAYEDRTRNEYIPAGPLVQISAGSATVTASWGDTWISYFDVQAAIWNTYYDEELDSYSYNGLGYAFMFPVSTAVNIPYRMDNHYSTVYENTRAAYFIGETGNSEFTVNGADYSPGWSNLYTLNTVYMRGPDARKYYPAPIDYTVQTIDDDLILASDAKIGNETVDPWTRWANNEYINVDNSYGPVNKLLAWKNHLLYWQEDNVGLLSVLDRSLISDNAGKSTSLGTGEILQRYDNISTGIGLSTRFSITSTLSGVYWYDDKRKKFHRFRDSIEDLSTVKGVNSYFNDIPDTYADYDNTVDSVGTGFFLERNPLYNEVHLSIMSANGVGEALIYNEILDAFTGFYDTKVNYQFSVDKQMFSTYGTALYEENIGNYGHLYGTYYDSYVTPIVNPMPNIPVTFTNYEISSEVFNGAEHIHETTISSIRTVNDYQDTEEIDIDSSVARRVLRTWRVDAGRDAYERSRLRDTYAKVTLRYRNDATNYSIVLHDLLTLYMVPAESIANKQQR